MRYFISHYKFEILSCKFISDEQPIFDFYCSNDICFHRFEFY